jgi:hypothetical protein
MLFPANNNSAIRRQLWSTSRPYRSCAGRRSLGRRRFSSAESISTGGPWDLSKVAPNWLAYQLKLISNFDQVRIIANQEAAVVL